MTSFSRHFYIDLRAVLTIASDTLTLLCRRRLFWLNVWLSVIVVLGVASVSCGQTECSVGFGLKSWPSSYLTKGSEWEKTLFLEWCGGLPSGGWQGWLRSWLFSVWPP